MVVTMKKLTAEEKIRMEMEAREDYERRMSTRYHSGLRDGVDKLNHLYGKLMEENRLADMRRAIQEPAYRQHLLEELE